MNVLRPVWRVVASYELAFGLLLALLWLTYRGTIAQVDQGLYLATQNYFTSWFVRDHIKALWLVDVSYWFPAGNTLLSLLALNLVAGGFIRIKKDRKRVGVLITHAGMVLLLLAGAVKLWNSEEGHLTLFEGQLADQFQSYHEYQLAITRDLGDGRFEEHVVDGEDFVRMKPGETRRFTSDALPFDVELSQWMENCQPQQKGPMFDVDVPVVDGVFLQRLQRTPESEQNLAGAYATLIEKDGGQRHQGILWGWDGVSTASWSPWVEVVRGTPWAVELRHKRYPMPFTLRLEDFTADFHPRTTMASNYESDVTKIEGDVVQPVHIRMNEPLREGDYVVYQSSYGPSNARPGDRMFSTFSVVRNPSDKWPEIACWVIAAGLLIHFSMKLFRYIRSESKKAVA